MFARLEINKGRQGSHIWIELKYIRSDYYLHKIPNVPMFSNLWKDFQKNKYLASL